MSYTAEQLADLEAIRDAAKRYSHGVDRLDGDWMKSAYWPDGTDDHGVFVGNAWEFVDHCMASHGRWRSTMHCIYNHQIDLGPDGTTARGEVYNVTHLFRGDSPTLETWYGRYLDQYEQRDGEWRILHRVCVHEGSTTGPVTPMPIGWEQFRPGSFDRPFERTAHRPMSEATAPFTLDPEALACPYPHYEALRAQGRAPYVDEVQARVVTGYADICEVMRRPGVASSRTPTGPVSAARIGERISEAVRDDRLTPAAQQYLREPHDRTLFTIDPPDHTRQRRVVARFFAPQKVAAWEPYAQRTAEELVDRYLAAGGGDFVADVAVPYPVRVIAWLLRIPPEDHGRLKSWSNDLTAVIGDNHPSVDAVAQMMASRAEMMAYFSGLLDAARAEPGPDLVTDVAFGGADDDGGRVLTESERIGLLINFLVAGNETSTKLFVNCARALAEQADLWDLLREDPSRVPVFVEEVVRLEPPTQAMYRQLREATDVAGEACAAGDHVLLLFAAGNRDAAEFTDPNRIDLSRSEATRHLSFGHGAHLCLGAGLARMEARALVTTLLDRTGGLTLAAGNDFACEPSYLLHGLRRLDLHAEPPSPRRN